MSISINGSSSATIRPIQKSLVNSEKDTQKALAKLSSGKKINSAQDDAANLAIGVQLVAQLTSANQAANNGNDALSVTDTADAALGDSTDILSRLNELAIQAASGALNDSDRADIQTEADGLKNELDRVANSTELNGTQLLSSSAILTYQVGTGNVAANDRLAITTGNATTGALGLTGLSLATQSSAQGAIGSIDSALDALSSTRSTLGAQANRASSAIAQATQTSLSLATANSSIQDADIATEASNLSRSLILGQANVAVLAQANQSSGTALRLLA